MNYDQINKALKDVDTPADLERLCSEIGGSIGVHAKRLGLQAEPVTNRFQSSFQSGYKDPNWKPDTSGQVSGR